MTIRHFLRESGENPSPKTGGVPERADIDEKYKWRLEDIYSSLEEWEKVFSEVSARVDKITRFAGTVGESSVSLLSFLREGESVSKELGRLYVYANMKSHEDLRVTRYQEASDKAESLMTRYSASVSFFQPEILALPDGRIDSFLKENDELKIYGFYFSEMLRGKEHILSSREEELLARANEMANVAQNAFTMLTDADIKFPVIKDETGQDIELTEERYYRLSRSPSRDVRRAAFEGIHNTYGLYKNSIGALYAGSVKGDLFYARERKYKNTLDSALFSDNVPESVYNNVVGAAIDNAPFLHRYMSLRKRVLGLDELHFYDLNVPLSEEPQSDIPYEEAVNIVAEALSPLGDDYTGNLKRGFQERWIDVYENQGKRKGAYSWGSYGTRPYVLLNYNGTLRDVFTIAHEMGHSLHSWYSHSNQPQVYADYTILLAEVASTTNESLLLEHLLRTRKEEREKKWLLTYYFDMVRTTFYRQAMFADYEKATHSRAESGEALSPAWLCALWGELCAKYYGSELVIDDSLRMEWARIPHFYTAFYVYKYVTGFTAAGSFAASLLNTQDAGARERYLTFLKSGGSDFSLDILGRAGVDLRSREPFEATLRIFEEKLKMSTDLFFRTNAPNCSNVA
ncbi:oligoendopeptidase F [Synergistales bacterium]|nr:oligoendopeptidase F [Synergistales bacterium]